MVPALKIKFTLEKFIFYNTTNFVKNSGQKGLTQVTMLR